MRRFLLLVCALGCLLVAGCTSTSPANPPSDITVEPIPLEIHDEGDPVKLTLPALNVSSSLVPLGLTPSREHEVPPVETPLQAGWYTGGPRPGEPGPAIILGHINGGGRPGIFHDLAKLKNGDLIDVFMQTGVLRTFQVYKVETVEKDSFPADRVYAESSDPQIRLITCGGDYNASTHSYKSNIIAYGKMV